jgi:hypothetical protein
VRTTTSMQGLLCLGKCMMSLLCVLPTQLHSDTGLEQKKSRGHATLPPAQYRSLVRHTPLRYYATKANLVNRPEAMPCAAMVAQTQHACTLL